MISFLRKWFGFHQKNKPGTESKKSQPYNGIIDFKDSPAIKEKPVKTNLYADVHVLMIQATKIKRESGYPEAIGFLKEIADEYLKQKNTALVTCINKLIPYMKREESFSFNDTYDYLEDVLKKMPDTDPLFLSLHITMAELKKTRNIHEGINYLEQILENTKPNIDYFNIMLKLCEFYIEIKNKERANLLLKETKGFLSPDSDRFEYIIDQRKWHEIAAFFYMDEENKSGQKNYLFNKFLQTVFDMAIVLNPIEIENFHERKKLYYNRERGFEDSEDFISSMDILGLPKIKKILLKEFYSYLFNEVPLKIGLNEKQLNYVKGDPESLEEVREKKNFLKKRFIELPELEKNINQLLEKHIL